MIPFFALMAVAGFALYVMSPEERKRLLQAVLSRARDAQRSFVQGQQKRSPFGEALVARTPRIFVAPAIAAFTAVLFIRMLFGAGSLGDPETLVAWGASIGPRTTNGEWWRLLASMFVHGGFIQLVVNAAALLSLGVVLERLVGHFAFAAVFLSSALVAAVVSTAVNPVEVAAGASGGIYGLYGVLLVTSIRGAFHPSSVTLPLHAAKSLAVPAGVFVLYNSLSGSGLQGAAELAALGVGLVCAAALVREVNERKPAARRVAAVVAATVVVGVASAIPLAGVTDVRQEIAGVLAIEARTAAAYDEAVGQFRKGWLKADALIALIDRNIVPDLRAARERVLAVKGVPAEQQSLVANAEEYLRLREESWRLRAEALQNPSTGGLRKADRAERASLQVFERIRPADLQ